MKERTRVLKEEMSKDLVKMHNHNNSKAAKRSPEQNRQAREDKQNYFKTKWEGILAQAETAAQRRYCDVVLSVIDKIR